MHAVLTTNAFILAGAILVMAVCNWIVATRILRQREKQHYVTYEMQTAGLPGRIKSLPVRYALPSISAMIAMFIAFVHDPYLPPLISGGYLITQLLGTGYSLGTLLAYRNLASAEEAVRGQISYSQVYQYKHQAAYLFGFALSVLAIAALSGSFEFLGATIWLGGSSAGYYRRARQAKAARAVIRTPA